MSDEGYTTFTIEHCSPTTYRGILFAVDSDGYTMVQDIAEADSLDKVCEYFFWEHGRADCVRLEDGTDVRAGTDAFDEARKSIRQTYNPDDYCAHGKPLYECGSSMCVPWTPEEIAEG